MMKVPVEVFVMWRKWEWEDAPRYTASSYDASAHDPSTALVTTLTIEAEIPDNFDPTPQQISALKNEQSRILAEAQVKANNIEEQIQRLLCIEFKPEAVCAQ